MKALGLDIPTQFGMNGINPDVVWQQYNPHPKLQYLMNTNDDGCSQMESPDDNEDFLSEESNISAGLRELLFLYSGAVRPEENRDDIKVVDLVRTRDGVSGLVGYEDLSMQMRSGDPSAMQLQVLQGPPTGGQVIAAYIEGVADESGDSEDPENDSADESPEDADSENAEDTNEDKSLKKSRRGPANAYQGSLCC